MLMGVICQDQTSLLVVTRACAAHLLHQLSWEVPATAINHEVMVPEITDGSYQPAVILFH